MNRGHFLTLALGAGMGSMVAVGSERAVPGSLEGWAARYGFSVSEGGKGVSLQGGIRADQLATGLQELAALSESAMRAEGNVMTGMVGERPFQVVIKQR
ncbi:MAG: hypothetical protein ACSHYF_02895 [Verrucomicrobiaceae bacterium]